MLANVIYVSICYLFHHTCSLIGNPYQHRLSMSEYMNNMGIGDLCQHRLSMSAYMFNVAKGDLCQHIISKSPYIDGMGDLCQHRLSTLEFINNICINWIWVFVYNCLVGFKTTPSANNYQDFANFPTFWIWNIRSIIHQREHFQSFYLFPCMYAGREPHSKLFLCSTF